MGKQFEEQEMWKMVIPGSFGTYQYICLLVAVKGSGKFYPREFKCLLLLSGSPRGSNKAGVKDVSGFTDDANLFYL